MIVYPRQTSGAAVRRLLTLLSLALATALVLAVAPGATAAPAKSAAAKAAKRQAPSSVNKTQLRRAQKLLALAQTGTHDARTRASVRRFQRYREIASHGIVDRVTYRELRAAFALLSPPVTAQVAQSSSVSAAVGGITVGTEPVGFTLPPGAAEITGTERRILDAIGECESGGNARILSAGGQYRGKYQFSKATWATVGGSGDPAKASETEQDHRAAILLRRQGTKPWPSCGAKLR